MKTDWAVYLKTGEVAEVTIDDKGRPIKYPSWLPFTDPKMLAHGFRSEQEAIEYAQKYKGQNTPDTFLGKHK